MPGHPARPSFVPFITLLLAIAPGLAVAWEWGPSRSPGELGSGGLLIQSEGALREAPTISTDVSIRVTGLIARTDVIQRFENPTSDWVEGVYVFPLPEGSAVDTLEMRIGDRVIQGHVEERARAKATYEKAKQAGRRTALVEQERPNVFTISIANLGPKERVEVRLSYQEDARYDQGSFSLRFPMVVAPRYTPGIQIADGFAGTGWAANTDEVRDASRITPPVLPPSLERSHPVTMHVEIDAGFALEDIVSASHPIRVKALAGKRYAVDFRDGPAQARADFALSWRPVVGSAPAAAIFREPPGGSEEASGDGSSYGLLMLLPPQGNRANAARVSRELILVIDTSGSMGGESIMGARKAVLHALDTLAPEDAFDVIEFNSHYRSLFGSARPATASAIEQARRFVRGLQADGGTNMQPALEAALTRGRESRAVRQVIFVTDGAVGNERALFELIERRLGQTRLFTVGIGSAPNSHLMSKAAEVGRGTFTYVGRPDEVAARMGGLFLKIDHPVFHDLDLDWQRAGVEAWPERIPDLYLGEPIVVAARLPRDTSGTTRVSRNERIVLTGRRGGQPIRLEIPLSGGSPHAGISKLWARRKVEALMDSMQDGASVDAISRSVATLGVRHQIVTRWSSLVAVDVIPTAPIETAPDTRAIPSLLPRGWLFDKVFGAGRGTPATPTPLAATRMADANKVMPVGQPLAHVQVGRLPQGGTPAPLLIGLGASLLAASLLLARTRRRREGEPFS